MRVLLVDDDEALRTALADLLAQGGHRVQPAESGRAALGGLADADVLVTDLRMPGMDGLDLVREARRRRSDIEVIVMTGFGTVPTALTAMRLGARAYLTKPFEPEELLLHLREVDKLVRLRAHAAAGRGALLGASEAMRRCYAELDLAAGSDAPALISGETGSGKELAARALHDGSPRANRAFVAVNCGALPRDLVEGELFGHEAGAFTGAQQRRRGRFVLADRGTLFLDEIDSLPLELQPKLLRALEAGEVWPLGAEKPDRVDVRVIAATNTRLEAQVEAGRFRQDLFYRLAVMRIAMPPLREHPEDIPQLVRAWASAPGQERPWTVSPATLAELVARPWPGNVRELKHAVERARLRAQAATPPDAVVLVEPRHLDTTSGGLPRVPFKQARERAADAWAERTIRAALEASGGNVTQAARQLQMARTALIRLVDRYGLK